MRRLIPVAFLILLGACGGGGSAPTTPTPVTPTPTATTFSLSGGVLDNKVNSNKVANASLTIQDGANAGKATTADGAGNYRFSGLTPGSFTIALSGAGYISTTATVTLGTADKTQNLFMDPIPPPPLPIFTISGTGDSVFTIPSTVARIRVDATFPGSCQNFIVHISTQAFSLINIIIGTCSVADTRSPFSGTYATPGGGQIQITNSTGVSWTFTELR